MNKRELRAAMYAPIAHDVIKMRKSMRKGLDFSRGLRYTQDVINKTIIRRLPMDNTKKTLKKINVKHTVAMLLATPLITIGVSSLVSSQTPYVTYALGAVVAIFIAYLVLEHK